MIVLIGMAVGVDYTLFYLKREREERAKGHGTVDAVEIAAATSGHSILRVRRRGHRLHGGPLRHRRRHVQLPGHRVDPRRRGRRPRLDHRAAGAARQARSLGRPPAGPAAVAAQPADRPGRHQPPRPAARSPGTRSSPWSPRQRSSVLLALPALGLKLHSGNLETLPDDIAEVQTFKRDDRGVPGRGHHRDRRRQGLRRRPRRRRRRPGRPRGGRQRRPTTSSTPGRISSRSPTDGTTSVLRLAMPYDESDERVDSAIEQLRADLAPAALDDLDAEYAVGGGAAESLDFVNQQKDRLPLVIGTVLLLTLLMMALAFRSVPIALVSTLLNLASVGAAFGILTIVFQHGYFESALDFSSPGFVIDWIPLFVMVVLVGLSMDYHVFVLSRVREYVRLGLPTKAGGRARHQRHGRRRDQRGRRHGLGVRDLRDAVDDGDEDDGRRALGRDPARRDDHPPGDAARDPGPARRPGLVAEPPASRSRGSRSSRPSRRTSWPVARQRNRLDVDRYAVQCGVAGHVEAFGVGEVVDRHPGHLRRVPHPGAVDLVPVAVGERHHAGHHVVGRRRPRRRPRRRGTGPSPGCRRRCRARRGRRGASAAGDGLGRA